MSTRAVVTFKDGDGSYSVYKHCDGYPEGVRDALLATLASEIVWPMPRFEADEFAAAFVAVNKTRPGGIRLTKGPRSHGDLEHKYEVAAGTFGLQITHYALAGSSEWAMAYRGPLSAFKV